MRTKLRNHAILLLTLMLVCMLFVSCGSKNDSAGSDKTSDTVAEQTADSSVEEDTSASSESSEKVDEPETVEPAKAEDDNDANAENEKTDKKEEKAKEKKDKAKKDSSKKKDSSSAEKKTEKKKVWVEPVTETRTVTLKTGTIYCNGPNSNGGCGASWHGEKNEAYDKWYDHWQDYVKKRTAEEEAKGKVYKCDHVHDDYRWVPDTTTETVVVQEGYWKEVD